MDVTSLVHTDLAAGTKKMQALGFEIVYSSADRKTQLWWNEAGKTCVSMGIKGKEIDTLSTFDAAQCEQHVDAARRIVYPDYASGQANVNSPTLDEERERLTGQGYKATYSIRHAAPGRGAEYWSNAETKKCLIVAYQTNDNAWVKTANAKPKACVNPGGGKSK